MEPIEESVEVAQELGQDTHAEDLLAGLRSAADRVQAVVPDCIGLSLAWLDQGVTFTLVASDEEIAVLDALQYLAGGPLLQDPFDPSEPSDQGRAAAVGTPGAVDPLEPVDPLDEAAWHMYAMAGAAKSIKSTLTLPQLRDGAVVGSANLYAASTRAFDGHHQTLADILDASADGAVRNADLSFSTRRAAEESPQSLADHDTLNHAIGMVVSALGVAPGHAEERLREAARRAGLTPIQLAHGIVTLLGNS